MKCFVFDFDCTLTSSHYYFFIEHYNKWRINTGIDKGRDISYALRKFREEKVNYENCKIILEKINPNYLNIINECIMNFRIQDLKCFLDFISKKGYDIFISSRGYVYDIGLFLYLFDIQNIEKIYGTKPYVAYFPKRYVLKKLYKKGYDFIFYIDDTHGEHYEFLKIIQNKSLDLEYYFYDKLKENGQGLTKEMMKGIMLKIKNEFQE